MEIIRRRNIPSHKGHLDNLLAEVWELFEDMEESVIRWGYWLEVMNHRGHEERLRGIKEMKTIDRKPVNQFPPPFMLFMVKSVSKIDPFFLNHQRTLQDLGVNGTYILAKDADEEELNRGKEE